MIISPNFNVAVPPRIVTNQGHFTYPSLLMPFISSGGISLPSAISLALSSRNKTRFARSENTHHKHIKHSEAQADEQVQPDIKATVRRPLLSPKTHTTNTSAMCLLSKHTHLTVTHQALSQPRDTGRNTERNCSVQTLAIPLPPDHTVNTHPNIYRHNQHTRVN